MKVLKGLHVYIYKHDFIDSLSPLKDVENVTIIDEEMPEIFEADERFPAVRIVRRNLFGAEYIHAEPYKKGNYAFGGRFIYTSDSRLRKISKYPIPLHDRDMSLEQH